MFFFIGASRTGSTWLARALKKHDQISLPINKPARFWNQKILGFEDKKSNFPRLTLAEYMDLYESEKGIMKGDMTDGYNILGVPVIKAIRTYFPQRSSSSCVTRGTSPKAISSFISPGRI